MPAISVIVPIYNTPIKIFRRCINSIRSQSFDDYEVILIDDGSANGVGLLCDKCAEKDPRFRVIHQKNKGLPAARNAGLEACLGEWFLCLDPDDWWEKNTLELLYGKIEKEHPDILIFGWFDNFKDHQVERRYFPEGGNQYRVAQKALIRNMQLGIMNEFVRKVSGYSGSVCMVVINRRFAKENRLSFNENLRLMEDGVYSLYLLEAAKQVAIWDIPLYHYRQHKKSATKRYTPEISDIFSDIFMELYNFIQLHKDDKGFFRAYEVALARGYLRMLQRDLFSRDNPLTDQEKKQRWETAVKTKPFFQQLKKTDPLMLYKCRKYYGCMHFLTFKLRSYRLLKWSFKLEALLKKV